MLPFPRIKYSFAVFMVFSYFTPLAAWLWNDWDWDCTTRCTVWNTCMVTNSRDVSMCGQAPENCDCGTFADSLGFLNDARIFTVEPCDLNKLYCGHELSRMTRWFVERPDHLFRCAEHTGVTTVRRCERACVNNGVALCSCAEGATYCWRELEELGYSDLQRNAWYKCLGNGIIEKGDECGDGAQCTDVNKCKATIPCIHGMSYCGFQLDNFASKLTELNNNTLYVCHEGSPVVYKECSSSCFHSAATQVATCSPRCQDDRLYCGHQLPDSLLNPNTIYECRNGTITEHERCAHACINTPYALCTKQCQENIIYCGHELQQMAFDFDGLVAQALYWCQSPQNIQFLRHCTDGCTEEEVNSRCLPSNQPIGDLACGTPDEDDASPLVIPGKVSTRSQWPWLVSLQGRSGLNKGHFCGGVIINKQWVLTAAHCLDYPIPWIIIGEYDLWRHDRGQINATIAKGYPHEMYKRNQLPIMYDIALLKLAQPIQYSRFVKPICLPTPLEVTQMGEKYTIAGWGQTYGNLWPHILRDGKLEILGNSVCADISQNQIFNETTMICAGQNDESDTIACKGDSGGPLVGRNTHGSYVVHGLVSYSKKDVCKLATNMYGVYTKVSAYVQWIEQTIARET